MQAFEQSGWRTMYPCHELPLMYHTGLYVGSAVYTTCIHVHPMGCAEAWRKPCIRACLAPAAVLIHADGDAVWIHHPICAVAAAL